MTKEYVNLYDAHGRSLGATNEWQRVPDAFDYIIFQKGDVVKAKNGRTGRIEFKGNNYADIVDSVMQNLTQGVVKVVGTFEQDKMITVKSGVTIDLTGAKINITADVDGYYIEKDAKIIGGEINVTYSRYTKTVIKLHGEQQYRGSGHNTTIKGIRLINAENTGIAVGLYCENAGECIGWTTFDNIQIERFEYGILIKLTNTVETAWINGNLFNDIKMLGTTYGIWLERNTALGSTESACNNNFFENIRYQATGTTQTAVRVQGIQNVFDVKVWDMHLAQEGALAFDIDADAQYTMIKTSTSSDYIQNNGSYSLIITSGADDKMAVLSSTIFLKNPGGTAPPIISITPPTAAEKHAIRVVFDGETYPRFLLTTLGRLKWSDGTNPIDVELYRDAADLLYTPDYFQAEMGLITKVDVGDYGGNFANYTPPTGREGLMIVAIDTNATNPGKRLYVYANGQWNYVDFT